MTDKSGGDDLRAAAAHLFEACSQFVAILDHPPASIDTDSVARAKAYRVDIWLIETATALNTGVKQPDIALDRLAKLDAVKEQLTPAQKTAVLRYRIQAYQSAGEPEKAFAVVQEYAKAQGTEANEIIRTMAYSTLQEIADAEKTNPEQARRLAHYVVKLMEPLIQATDADPAQKDLAYDYRKLQSDMLLRAGELKEAQSLAVKLETDRPQDLFNYMTEARSLFEQARGTADSKLYAQAEDEFTRILPQLTNGGDSFWECWLRILQAKEILAGPDAGETIKKRLNDLRAGFGDKLGGEKYKAEFSRLAGKYGV